MSRLRLTFRDLPVYSLAAQQNAYRLFSNAKLEYFEDPLEEGALRRTLRNLTVTLTVQGGMLQPEIWQVSQLAPGQHVTLQDRSLKFSHDFLLNLSDETQLQFEFVVTQAGSHGEPLHRESVWLTILPANFWGGEARQPELLAAFVKPNGVYVESLVRSVTEVLERSGQGRSADGYQSNSREKPYYMAAALWSVVAAEKIAYVSPPPSYAYQGQLVRLASDISNNRMAACLDLSLLFASCLELMGLNTVIALTNSHAVVGAWLIDSKFPLLANDDPMELRKRVDARDLVLFEATMATNTTVPTFLQACEQARALISEDAEDDFVYAIDIGQARARKIKPMATVEDKPDESASLSGKHIILPPAPPLPPVRADEIVVPQTPDTRIDNWQRKLLDLTKRNPLLAFKDRSAGVRIHCPDIGEMEDQLAQEAAFSFLSAEASPFNDPERSSESFRLATGNNLHREFALEQLANKRLVANTGKKKLETTLVSLFRKAKNDLQEGGANTLFIALGMLSWKESPDDDRSYRAPLILIPVELTRRSALAPIKLRKLADEEPLFNLTLIEFLQNEHEIDLSHLGESLPVDDYGVDVARIWQEVRHAVSEQPGFEVVEESVIASFSFAKYLMWKDLRERLEELKENPFVRHLADHPTEAYEQSASFLLRDEIDEKIDPSEIFVPLNADSSQLVAVEAASRPQDFVLEGPPGTGKSETIANIIANNLAQGRKVLFVAEKIAALQVVYRRLEKIGLDHLCLELHSNKANKKAVLNQLLHATEVGAVPSTTQWIDVAKQLRARRDELNTLVRELHAPSRFGISPRAAISRVAAHKGNLQIVYDWGVSLSDCPFSDEVGLVELREAARAAGTAYGDIRDLDPTTFRLVRAKSWSFAWQAATLEHAKAFLSLSEPLTDAAKAFAARFNLAINSPTGATLNQLGALAKLVDIAQRQSIAFAVGPNVGQRLEQLATLATKKASLDARLQAIAHGATAPRLISTPVEEWISLFEVAQQNWFKKLFIRRKLNKIARSVGYQEFAELDILYELRNAKQLAGEIERIAEDFREHGIWDGWNVEPESLRRVETDGRLIHELIKQIVGLTDDPMEMLIEVKTKFVDGREFLDGSQLIGDQMRFGTMATQFDSVLSDLASVGLELNGDAPLSVLHQQLTFIVANAPKLKPWVEWVEARERLDDLQLGTLGRGLESGAIPPEDVEDQAFTAFCAWLAPRLIDEREPLRLFSASKHNQRLEEFQVLDAKVAETASGYITATLAQSTPDITSKENKEHFGTLSHELQKKTKHKPIRMLFESMGERLLDLTPCLMMSPLSVAQFLPTNFKAFDMVVFDEASQIPTWDAVGAIARGRNVVIVGDPKQMPPTNFFNTTIATDDSDEEDLESILDQALAAGLPHLRLMGHYRSRHETLIAFSNSKYYDNSLVTYPSSDTKKSAVVLRRVDGVYAKGKGRNNPTEARVVVEEVVRRLRHPRLRQLSLGIVTLNTEQQRTIEDRLDEARRRDPEIEVSFQATNDYDPVFVKNLESVQGDERDVIIFSLGYGPTEPGAKTMSMNFGPLNKQGGERRLNVAITRATTEVVVFSSFDPAMIGLSRTSALAVEHLKHYLEFAEKGPIALAEQSTAAYGTDQFDSDFEEAVARDLRNRGWQAQTQVGVSKFRVDLGIVHPDQPGRYLAGVECDGATYHGSPSARDRDRTRQAILENLGWQLIRLWSTDYFRDPDDTIQKVHERLNEILTKDRARTPPSLEPTLSDIHVDFDTPMLDGHPESNEEAQNSESVKADADVYFESSHEAALTTMARQILEERPCITQQALALEVANLHGKKRTSPKQLKHLTRIVDPWAGIWQPEGQEPVYWSSPDEITEVFEWRGLAAFGYKRVWSEVAYPEVIGLAQEAIKQQPSDPVDYICKTFELKRRHPKTLEVFSDWVRAASQQDDIK